MSDPGSVAVKPVRLLFAPPLFLAMALGLPGCATLSDEADMTERAERAAADQLLDAAGLRGSIERDMESGRGLHFPFYAPLHWALAERSLAESAKAAADGEDDAEVKKPLLVAAQCLEASAVVRQQVLSHHADVLDAFRHLHDIEAHQAFPARFAERVSETAALMALVDNDEHDKADAAKVELMTHLRELEVATIGFQQLHLARKTVAQVRAKDGDKTARVTLARAEKALARAEALVAREPRNDDVLTPVTRKAYLAARHALAIVQEARAVRKALKDADVDDPTLEALLLRFEGQLDPVAQSLSLPDLRFMPLGEQAGLVAAQATLAGSGRREPLQEPVHTTREYLPDGPVPEGVPALPPEFLP